MISDLTPDLLEILGGQHPIVVLAPHPDDESLGCGALLARAFAGGGAHIICLTDGSASHQDSARWPASKLAECRHSELETAIVNLGGTKSDMTWMGLPDAKLCLLNADEIAVELCDVIDAIGAECIFAPAIEDHHADHKVAAQIALSLKRLRPGWVFYSYPVWSRWDDPEFKQNTAHHAPISLESGNWRDKKHAAIFSHQSQLGNVVCDDPNGFVLPPALVEKFINEDEIFWRIR